VTYELALISVVIGAGYWGAFFVRKRPHGTATFGLMQLAAAALAGLGLLGRHHEGEADGLAVAGAVGIGAGTLLLVVVPLVRALAHRLVAAERVGLATRLLDVAEILAPGSGVTEEKALVRAMTEVREGRIEPTVEALTAAKQRAPAEAQLAIDERIATLYLAAYRWSDAIRYAEAHLFGAPPNDSSDSSLRRALGVSPPVWVELLGAYGRVGDLDQAAKMLARLEDVCAGRDDAAVWVHRARVMFLALAGRIDAVRALVAPRQARHMSTAARTYWLAVAHDHRGDQAAATMAYEKARARSRGRPRALIDQALAALAARAAIGELPRPALAPVTSAVVTRIEAQPLPPPIRLIRPRGPRATWILTLSLLAASGAVAIAGGSISDLGVLVRAGALVRGVVAGGEWWRLVTCIFLHVGTVHLVLNASGMFILGRLAEDLFGAARMFVIFMIAGITGAVASYLAAPAGISAGASGAVFGLLGAVLVELTVHRGRYRNAWKRGMFGGLAVITVAQLGYGFVYPVVDQWAHGGGLAAGAVAGLLLSPSVRWYAIASQVARALAVGFAATVVAAAAFAVATPIGRTLDAGGTQRQVVDGVAIAAPRGWETAANQIYQPDGLVVVRLAHQARAEASPQVAMWIAEVGRHLKDELGGELTRAPATVIGLPAGWDGTELEAAPEDAMGYHQRVRIVVCGRAFGDVMIFVAVQVPETIARGAPEFFAQLLASIGPA
jgi:membrane associated rhomboid family serine protease/tetratricopeptide (TPR) repeat protein